MKAPATCLYGLVAAAISTAQVTGDPDGINDFKSDGPFALQVKGQALNSSIAGYVYALPTFGTQWLLQYEPGNCPRADNSSFQFYFNYTGEMKSQETDIGFFVTDYTVEETNEFGLKGKAVSLQFDLNTNIGLPIMGIATAVLTGFNAENKTFLTHYMDDSTAAPGKRPPYKDYRYYNWAVCWQAFSNVYAPILSWVTTGRPHNPTCELVDLVKVNL
ncbi:hypothetical protein GQX73_g7174 [Xylaria multiplex]|uniref:Uncharacterized protein n=1 Tax=Xylaria multiplex TaxID=323545 RepID=A0A7C8N4H7_9PEZI|nr:hypothetical protein GQX73_g7174 [Xylaria multiplex]